MKREVRILCDECGTFYPYTFIEDESRDRMYEDGWVKTDEDPPRDLCPEHALTRH